MKGEGAFEAFARFDATLADLGFPPLSPFAMSVARRYFMHPTARTLVLRWGRGAGKSSFLVKFALFHGLFGQFVIPQGERHYFPIVSENVAEAIGRLRLMEAKLSALGVRFTRVGDVIDLVDLPIGFRVVACRIGAVSGFRAIGWGADEVSKWPADPSNPSPAREVIASMRAMTVTHANAPSIVVSSPMATVDYHFELCELGDTENQIVSVASTWAVNPLVSEERTRQLEPDPRIWSREYAAIPQAAAAAAFDELAVSRMFEAFEPGDGAVEGHPVLVIDASSGRSDSWTWTLARWVRPAIAAAGLERRYHGFDTYTLEPVTPTHEGEPFSIEQAESSSRCDDVKSPRTPPLTRPPQFFPATLIFQNIGGVEGRFWQQISADRIVANLADLCRKHRIRTIIGDQRESLLLQSAFAQYGLRFVAIDWTAANKPAAVARLRRWLREGQIKAPLHEGLRRELLSFEEKITASGAITFGARGNAHDDYVALLITAAMADEAGLIPHSPTAPSIRRNLFHLPKY